MENGHANDYTEEDTKAYVQDETIKEVKDY